jgi:hypothetical protein
MPRSQEESHVIMYRQVSETGARITEMMAVCSCGWETAAHTSQDRLEQECEGHEHEVWLENRAQSA